MNKRKNYTSRTFKRLLLDNGFCYNRTRGSHDIYIRNGVTIAVPLKLNAMIALRLIKENDLV